MSKLGSLLVREGLLSETDRRMIRRESRGHRGSFARSVIALGLLDEDELAALFAAKTVFKIADKDLTSLVSPDAISSIPVAILQWFDVIPVSKKSGVLLVAMVDPTDLEVIAQLEFFSGLQIRPLIAPLSSIRAAIGVHLSGKAKFARSEFEDFLENHSAHASRFAKLRKGEIIRSEASSESSFDADDSDPESAFVRSDGAEMFELLTDESEAEAEAAQETGGLGLADDEFAHPNTTGKDNLGDPNGSLGDDLSELSDDDALNEEGLGLANAGPQGNRGELEPIADVPDLEGGLNLEGIEDDLDFDIGEEAGGDLGGDLGVDLGGGESQDDDGFGPAPAKKYGSRPAAGIDALVSGGESADPFDAIDQDLNFENSGAAGLGQAPLADKIPDSGLDVGLDFDSPTEDPGLLEDSELVKSDDGQAASSDETDDSLELGGSALDPSLGLGDLEDLEVNASPPALTGSDLLTDQAFDLLPEVEPNKEGNGADSDSDLIAENLASSPQIFPSPHAEDSIDEPDVDMSNSADVGIMSGSNHVPEISVVAHQGIATLNRAMVNLAMMMDSKKAFNRLVEASLQVGIPSGAIFSIYGDELKLGVLWGTAAASSGASFELPVGITGMSLAASVEGLAAKESWCPMQELFDSESKLIESTWQDQARMPTHIYARKSTAGYIVGFAQFSGEANHQGLKESYAELIKAAGHKIS